MYAIYSFNKRYNTKSYLSYDEARDYVRRLIRKWGYTGQANPAMGAFGFRIKRV